MPTGTDFLFLYMQDFSFEIVCLSIIHKSRYHEFLIHTVHVVSDCISLGDSFKNLVFVFYDSFSFMDMYPARLDREEHCLPSINEIRC